MYNDLRSLEGLPDKILGSLLLTGNTNLQSLKGFPKTVGGNIELQHCGLTSLEGLPDRIFGHLFLSDNYQLKSLKGIPKEINGNLVLYNNHIPKSEMDRAKENIQFKSGYGIMWRLGLGHY